MGTSASKHAAAAAAAPPVLRPLTVVSPLPLPEGEGEGEELREAAAALVQRGLPAPDAANDALDAFNRPRLRRTLIVRGLFAGPVRPAGPAPVAHRQSRPVEDDGGGLEGVYGTTHSRGLLQFLSGAWEQWERLGEDGRDPSGWSPAWKPPAAADRGDGAQPPAVPPLVPTNCALPRASGPQRPSGHVLGQIGYYCTDAVTPVFAELADELRSDAGVVKCVSEAVRDHLSRMSSAPSNELPPPVWYALPTHPGHHAAADSFGGYCYVNHAAALANLLSAHGGDGPHGPETNPRVAILDVDYHCGNGTADIFAERSDVLVVSLHCHPDCEYPFHSGFAGDTGRGDGKGATLHLPLPPGTAWPEYERALLKGLAKVRAFGAHVLLVSLGLDTHEGDPCAIRRAGFGLKGDDYAKLGRAIARNLPGVPLVFLQEGGYRLDAVGEAAASVLLGACSEP